MSLTFDGTDSSTVIDQADRLLATIIGAANYKIVGTRLGSIIVDVSTYAGAAVVVAATLRIVCGYAVSVYIEFLSAAASRRVLEKADTFDDLKQINEIQLTRNRINAGAAALHARQVEGLQKLEVKL